MQDGALTNVRKAVASYMKGVIATQPGLDGAGAAFPSRELHEVVEWLEDPRDSGAMGESLDMYGGWPSVC